MREIKSRVYDTKYKRMAESKRDHFFIDTKGDLYELTNYGTCGNNSFDYRSPNQYKVMEFTSKKDFHGKEIYEGDILKCISDFGDRFVEVYWCEIYACFRVRDKQDLYNENLWCLLNCYDCEIVGNIHENPELLDE